MNRSTQAQQQPQRWLAALIGLALLLGLSLWLSPNALAQQVLPGVTATPGDGGTVAVELGAAVSPVVPEARARTRLGAALK